MLYSPESDADEMRRGITLDWMKWKRKEPEKNKKVLCYNNTQLKLTIISKPSVHHITHMMLMLKQIVHDDCIFICGGGLSEDWFGCPAATVG
jgi:hypothetical protein